MSFLVARMFCISLSAKNLIKSVDEEFNEADEVVGDKVQLFQMRFKIAFEANSNDKNKLHQQANLGE